MINILIERITRIFQKILIGSVKLDGMAIYSCYVAVFASLYKKNQKAE